MWTETINEMKLLGATRHWRNPVQWGFLLRNLDLIYEVLLCMWTDCSGDGFTLRGLLLLVLWVLTADCWVPLATFGVKLLKNAFKEHGTANMREVGASLGESLLLVIHPLRMNTKNHIKALQYAAHWWEHRLHCCSQSSALPSGTKLLHAKAFLRWRKSTWFSTISRTRHKCRSNVSSPSSN